MKTVLVLLSTFNGEKYLREQINSLIHQRGVNVRILARDDGSNDSTVSLLEEYHNNYECFSYYIGENLGPTNSFFDLIRVADNCDYYALCDQDDIWDNDKLSIAVNTLEKMPSDVPALYYSNLRIVDSNKNFFRYSHNKPLWNPNKYSCFTENLCTGCTAVFNKSAKDLVANHIPTKCTMHDAWIYMVCKMFGTTIYDFEPHISYRQHSNNVVGANLSKHSLRSLMSKMKRFFDKSLQPRYVNASSFYNCFSEELDFNSKTKIKKIINYKESFYKKIVLIIDKDIKPSTLYGSVRFVVHVLNGTV